jgi:4-alpha-glucanotransferase
VLQYLFFRQWFKLKAYASESGIKIIGDMPIYVSPDSSDLWANHLLFQVDKDRNMKNVAGVPPDYFNEDGQLWGNPLYDWAYHSKQGYSWWINRIKYAEKMFDGVRIDHFRGFAGYYSIPAGSLTAAKGAWKKGPGRKLISEIKKHVQGFIIIAEDLGDVTPDVRNLLSFSGFPGMKILQFAFEGLLDNEYLPHNYEENCVVYTGTHDNGTTVEWAKSLPEEVRKFARSYLGVDKRHSLAKKLVSAAMYSKSNTCIIPLQDWLGLDKEARVNIPGMPEGNWRFRVRKSRLSDSLASRIGSMTEDSGRTGKVEIKSRH